MPTSANRLMPNQDAKSPMRNLLVGKTIRAVAHLDTGRVEHATFKSVDVAGIALPRRVLLRTVRFPIANAITRRTAREPPASAAEAIANRGGFKAEGADPGLVPHL